MERAVCPECRAPIGGSGHYLQGGNTRATEFEAIAINQGLRETPWTNPTGGF